MTPLDDQERCKNGKVMSKSAARVLDLMEHTQF